MEQRIDPNTQPGYAAGTDPAYIPGLTAPVTAGKSAPARGQQEQEQAEEPAPAAIAVDDAAEAEAEAESEPRAEADGAADDGEATADDVAPESGGKEKKGQRPEDGPVFEVSDRRGAITVNHEGVRFRLDDQEADFDWDEIGAVEVKTPRFGRRFTVTVHLATRRWFNAEVEAPARSDLKQWAEQLDAALDAYFEES
ncbi:hypothetical protein ACF1A9_06865 [Streptomyces sp. NPDC014872]|uniref:hypothetical protein n=1 Tax=Streptomyces sp. NPDC014872 TaxID=3364926 RepID=UPI0036FD5D10